MTNTVMYYIHISTTMRDPHHPVCCCSVIVDFPNVLHILWIALGIFGVMHRTRCQKYLISLTGVCCCLSSDVDLIYFYLFLR